jgi:hypothetical protein
MKIILNKQLEQLHRNHEQNSTNLTPEIGYIRTPVKPVVKLFGGSSCTWLLTEVNPDTNIAFGLCDLGQGSPELGYVSLDELESVKFPPFGLPIERDMHWEASKTITEYAEESRSLGYIKS